MRLRSRSWSTQFVQVGRYVTNVSVQRVSRHRDREGVGGPLVVGRLHRHADRFADFLQVQSRLVVDCKKHEFCLHVQVAAFDLVSRCETLWSENTNASVSGRKLPRHCSGISEQFVQS